jgi:hypothetical protein
MHHLSSVIRDVWRLLWHNCHKEILWRLAVHGVPWAGGHDIVSAQPCPCGWRVTHPSDTHAASLAWQEHCFWSCPVAQQVVTHLRRALPPAVLVSHAHLWLLLSPNELVVRPDVWPVCFVLWYNRHVVMLTCAWCNACVSVTLLGSTLGG